MAHVHTGSKGPSAFLSRYSEKSGSKNRKGGVYVHWDDLEARSPGNSIAKAVAKTMAQSHAHAARNHRAAVAGAVFQLFVNTPDSVPENKILNFVKEEVFFFF